MTDDPTTGFGLGAIDSPPDERDWSIDALFAAAGLEPDTAAPASYVVPAPYPPILSQGNTPRCVAFSSSTLKAYEDLRDTGPVAFDVDRFFAAIGGGPNGAVVRVALQQMLDVGYPPASAGSPADHRIAAYYSVPVDEASLKAALVAFGPLLISTRWYSSWFRPVSGILPAPDTVVGGHAIVAIGYDATGLRLRNSWGTRYGDGGDVTLRWRDLGSVKEAWKAVDQIVKPPATASYRLILGAGTRTVYLATINAAGRISGWIERPWTGIASSAPCRAPVVKRGTIRGQATVAYVTAGAFRGKWVRVAGTVSVRRS